MFKTLATAALVFGASAVAQTEGPLPADAKFTLMALRSASPVHFSSVSAAKSGLFLQLPNQEASCDGEAATQATFYLKDGGLFLYAASATPQQLYADRSGMGQGVIGFTTGAQPTPKNGERGTFALDANNNLNFNGAAFLACPNSIDGAWSLWVSTGVAEPAGNKDCLGVSLRAVEAVNPNGCVYTS
ncbi:cell wall protein PhiA [Durotheca rogersii]|uniref:cell wall protein PhiA n=1 Tax=Durotheca rogersii TaxID=419775 RepID=UPI002221206F|nr:cell wall protein PhiA [Durotheca rogersii]KAI5860944.1 cell wall protein PhiA [Durotheca rogersii]